MTLQEHAACQRARGAAKSHYLIEFSREFFSRARVPAHRGSVRARTPDGTSDVRAYSLWNAVVLAAAGGAPASRSTPSIAATAVCALRLASLPVWTRRRDW